MKCSNCGKEKPYFWFVSNGERKINGAEVTHYCSKNCKIAQQL